MALTPDAATLYVSNSGGEVISIVDPDRLISTGRVAFPATPFNSNLALALPNVIASSQAGTMFLMTSGANGSLWKVLGNAAAPRYTYAGVAVMSPELVKPVKRGAKAPLVPYLRSAADAGRLSGELFEGLWQDVGTAQRLAELETQLASRK